MSRTCGDCYYCKSVGDGRGYSHWECSRKKRTIDLDDSACSIFVSEDAKTCLYCYYMDYDSSFFGNYRPYCKRTNKRVLSDDKACSKFVED